MELSIFFPFPPSGLEWYSPNPLEARAQEGSLEESIPVLVVDGLGRDEGRGRLWDPFIVQGGFFFVFLT